MKKYLPYLATAVVLLSATITSCNKDMIEGNEIGEVGDASLDQTFGKNGMVVIPNTSEINLLDFDSHGNIVAAGYTLIGSGMGGHLTLAKIRVDGTQDKNSESSWLTKITDYDDSIPIGLKVTKENKIMVLGSFTKIRFQGRETILMRFNHDGTVDNTFGENGKVNLQFNAGYITSVNFDSDDFLLIAKRETEIVDKNGVLYSNLIGYSISKYSYSGVLDNSFGQNGVVLLINTVSPYSMRIVKNGSIIVAGTYNTWPNIELGLCKLTPSGKMDTGFANKGIWHRNVMQDFDLDHEYFSGILEDNNGNLILSGSGLRNSKGWGNRAFISKFSSNGKLDTSFGDKGFYCFDFGNSNNPVFQIGSNYVTAGWDLNESHKVVLVNNNGNFGEYIYTSGIYYFQTMKLYGDNTLYTGGGYRIGNSYNANFAVERVIID